MSLLSSLAVTLVIGCGQESVPAEVPVAIDPALLAAFPALPDSFDRPGESIPEARIALGERLYHETRLSKDGSLSCNSCHALDGFGVDGARFSTGVDQQLGGRNAPTVFNAAGHLAQFWDGRAADVEEQAKGPILNPVEMAMDSPEQVIAVLSKDPTYVEAFAAAFPGEAQPMSYDNLGRAIGAFERRLVTPGPWDAFVAGDDAALDHDQKRGFQAFLAAGCQACHNGALFGGGMYQKLGLVRPWPNQNDLGRGTLTGNEAENMVFKVPSLRNVAETGPYFHDGSVADLEQAVRLMAAHQLGKDLDPEQVAAIVTFLGSLTGSLQD